MSALRDLVVGEAELGSESDDGDFDEETGETRRKTNGTNGHYDDSSEEDEEDDEEEARAIREGFIVEEDEDDEDQRRRRRKERKKRRREEQEEEEAGLDEEDLDLIGEANPDFARPASVEPKLKRLKRGNRDERGDATGRGAGDLFDSDDDDDGLDEGLRRGMGRRPADGEMDGFIEDDEFSEGEGRDAGDDDVEVRRPMRSRFAGIAENTLLDGDALDDFKEAFGDGFEYDWALAREEEEDDERARAVEGPDGLTRTIELKDVFEPSQLQEKMLTDEDNQIRAIDLPERFQVARAPYKDLELTDEQAREESLWISNLMMPKKNLDPSLREPFQKAVAKVLDFMNIDSYEVPFIFQHRKDYLIHAVRVPLTPDPANPGAPEFTVNAEKLLIQRDLWEIFDLDLKFRALLEKRNALQKTYDKLKSTSQVEDTIFEEMLPAAVTMEELQDAQEYLYFRYASWLNDAVLINGSANGVHHKRPGASTHMYERVRNSTVYSLVRAFGISADAFAQNALKREGRRQYTEDPAEKPLEMAADPDVLDPPNFATAEQCLRAAKAMFAEEIAMSPKMRRVMRQTYYQRAAIDCFRTEKGLRKIDEQHPYYAFKYLRNLSIMDIAERPGAFLQMLKAEEEGLLEVRVRLHDQVGFTKSLYQDLESDNFSEVAEAWNRERRDALDAALVKLHRMMAKGLKENLKAQCETEIAGACREKFSLRLDQAPYKPKGMAIGTIPRVLSITNGSGTLNKDPIYWVYVEDDGRALENGKFSDLHLGDPERNVPDGSDVAALIDLIDRRKPDVIGVSGFSAETRRLVTLLKDIVARKDIRQPDFRDDDGIAANEMMDVVIVNDEVARLYQTSERAHTQYPSFSPLTRYGVALARYLQNPMHEYASLGRDIVSITFDPDQGFVPSDKILRALETALVDYVNLCGVDINEAIHDLATANLLPYVSGLGPRKAQQLVKVINMNGGSVNSRAELVGDLEAHKLPAVGPRVWNNCASFLFIDYEAGDVDSDYLDNTRVHPEDYDLGRKMAADALELDEEDIQAEVSEAGAGAIVRKLIKEDAQDKVNDLILEEYAEQLEKNFNQRKRATLETIRAELQMPYEELRRHFESELSTNEIFTMFTGETLESLNEGMTVAMSIRRVTDDSVEGRLDCGIDGTVNALEISDRMDVSARQLYQSHQTVQAKILSLNRKRFHAELSLLEDKVRRPYRRDFQGELGPDTEWDSRAEQRDRDALTEKHDVSGRAQRVVKHPLFRPFNAAQAEEFLGSQARGDVVIRPSSKGLDHLAVTWKVANAVYQHLDVLELDKENEFSVGRLLKVAGRWTYTDLDELIVNHVKAMARKVDEMMLHDKFQNGSKADTERWLTTYTEANPRRSTYAFCLNPKYPGYFFLCFKAGQHAKPQDWPVKVIPGAFELQKVQYQDMKALCNGFKMLFTNMQKMRR